MVWFRGMVPTELSRRGDNLFTMLNEAKKNHESNNKDIDSRVFAEFRPGYALFGSILNNG